MTDQPITGPDAATPDCIDTVRRFLAAMEARDLDAARALTAPGFRMTFPGGAQPDTLEALAAWARQRYRRVQKSFEGFDAAGGVVYCHGTLAGEWPDGTPFSGVRFIDRFEIADGLIVRQDVWNDLAEVRRGMRP